LGNFFTIPDLS